MVILSLLIELFAAQSQGHEQKALTLVLLCSVCFGWTKAVKYRLIFPSWMLGRRWFKTQKFILYIHSHPLGAYSYKIIHIYNSLKENWIGTLSSILPTLLYEHSNALKKHLRTQPPFPLFPLTRTMLVILCMWDVQIIHTTICCTW